ncbi:NAD(P)H-dependent oxidoreductase [Vibrio metschnikovii]|jgi:chromate reductase|uniref:NAD(P)H-dependent oxidoreductase n=5 Tax=Bacteria TaxID=2 RepID=A0A9X0R776_VIBME|nr:MULTISPECIES: NADPH-dependent FMN reductase [Vibrio]EEX36683.1 NADPH-dependent FMN reductase [Vibrio metschnikovii CIP 69.14]EKO3557248.1 NAD(P)H-dependent oxidoreductase [Vibrio metschnikovii]EKO3564445.1 NAD(P)H-dependent oxidoreductase [Vibrio metschnikovii]EKO3571830.1 NAD(P)H-dependent oxidoreductase [Vibrio metschnikovii]EKO3574791.1 NAD(P)H-dependent oxidoreductase [Vibrio metschnikovii]
MKVIAFGASTSSQSINQALATYAAKQIEGAQVTVLNINDYSVPMFSEDREKELGQAEGAQAFLRDLAQADAFVISFAEHNGHYPAAYKNLFDWTTRIDRELFKGKPAVYLATSPGPGGAQSVLAAAVASAPFFGGNVKGSLSVPSFYDNFDLAAGEVTNSEIAEKIKATVALLG